MTLNRSTYEYISILELAKLHMYRLRYDELKEKCQRTRLLMTDTDSFIYQIYCDDLNAELRKVVDFSRYDKCT